MTALARIAEEMEVAAWSSLVPGVPGGSVVRRGPVTVLLCPGVDSVLCNRAFGLRAPADVEAVLRLFEEAGVRRFLVHVLEEDEELAGELAARGLPRYPRAWVKLARAGRDPPPAAAGDLEARRTPPALAPAAGAVLAEGLRLPASAVPLLAAAVDRPGWRMFHVEVGGAPVAAALLFTMGEAAYLAGGATLPAFRARGAQSKLLEARIHAAHSQRCRVVVSETGEPVAGDPQHSQRNMMRFGLLPVGRRHNHLPAGATFL